MSAAYVRETYGVDFKVGDRVTVDGKPGVIVSFPDQYLGIRLDGEKRTSRAHPTWRVERETPANVTRVCVICAQPVRVVNYAVEHGREVGYLGRHWRPGIARTSKCSGSFGRWVR